MSQFSMVIMRLIHVWCKTRRRHEESPRRLQIPSTVLKDPKVVVGLAVVIVRHQSQTEALVGQVDVTNALR